MRAPLIAALIAATATAAMLVAAIPTDAALERRAGRSGPTTFDGSCRFSGVVEFRPALTTDAQPAKGTARAVGPCSGTVTGPRGREREIDRRRVRYVARNRGEVSCGSGVAEGGGALVFPRHRIRFRLEETRAAAAAALELRGRAGGSASGQARVSEREDPAEIAARCSGRGLRAARVDIDIATSPAISG